jgi:hypothetical protein
MRRDELHGCNRLIFNDDGSLYVGITDRGWERGSSGLKKITWTGKTPFEIKEMTLAKNGFDLSFTEAVDEKSAADPASYSLSCWHYIYSKKYGSPEVDKQPVKITGIKVSDDHKRVSLTVEKLNARQWVYSLTADGVKNTDGRALRNAQAYYTLNHLKQ